MKLNAITSAVRSAPARLALVAGSALAMASAHAQSAGTDYGAGAAIAATQTTVLTIIGGFITMGIAVWGASYILRRFFPKGR